MEEKKVIEAALFMSSRPLSLNELAKTAGISSLGYVKEIVEELQKEYENRGIEIINLPDGYSMTVKKDYAKKVSHLAPHSDMSEGEKKTLALVLYKEPAKQSEIIKIQGNKAYSYIKELEKKGFIKSEKSGRTKLLMLTPEFEKYFGEEREKIREMLKAGIERNKEQF